MKVLIVLLPYLASCFGGDFANSGSQRGLLVLPKHAPSTSAVNLNQYTANYNQQETPEILRPEFAERRGVYFVEVPQERIQALQDYRQQKVSQQNFQPSRPAQYNQQETTPVNVKYLPFEDSFAQTQSAASSSQYRQEEAVVRYLAVPLGGESKQYGQQKEQQAVVQYSEVQPISGPVYSYSPQAITRILRYAPVY